MRESENFERAVRNTLVKEYIFAHNIVAGSMFVTNTVVICLGYFTKKQQDMSPQEPTEASDQSIES